jgi:hypothetical protein
MYTLSKKKLLEREIPRKEKMNSLSIILLLNQNSLKATRHMGFNSSCLTMKMGIQMLNRKLILSKKLLNKMCLPQPPLLLSGETASNAANQTQINSILRNLIQFQNLYNIKEFHTQTNF